MDPPCHLESRSHDDGNPPRVSRNGRWYYTSASTLNLISYTATFGGGFYATLSVEDNNARRGGTRAQYADIDGEGLNPNPGGTGTFTAEVKGQEIPDIVAAIGLSQSWGNAQIMAAAHNIEARSTFDLNGTTGPTDVLINGEDWGYAVGAGFGVNLPVAAGGHFALEAVYADGALGYLGATGLAADHVISYDQEGTGNDLATGDLSKVETSTGWSVTGEFQVKLSPTMVATAFGSYVDIDPAGGFVGVGTGGVPSATVSDVNSYILGANMVYTITKGLTIGAEVAYTRTETDKVSRATPGFAAGATAAGPLTTTSTEDDKLDFGIRLERKW